MNDPEPSFSEQYPFFAFVLREFDELRRRLFWCLGALIVVSGVLLAAPSWDHSYVLQLSHWLKDTLLPGGAKLVFLSPLEPMAQMIKLALALGALLCTPLLLWHFVAFTKPALPEGLHGFYVRFVALGTLMMALGLFVSAVYLAPLTLKMLIAYGVTAGGEAQITFERFYSFMVLFLLTFSAPFEIPLVMGFFNRFNLVSEDWFRTHRFKAWGVLMLIAQLVTPDPVITPLIFTAMGIVLYEIGIYVGRAL